MKLSRIPFELIYISITLSPFIYLGLAWGNSAEAAKNSHNGLYVMMSLVVGFYIFPTILNYFDRLDPETHTMAANGRILKLIWVLFGACLGFYGLLSDSSKFDSIFRINILACIFMIIAGNYQSRIRPNSAYNALFMREYSDKVQAKANRYQGRVMILSGILLAIIFLIMPRTAFVESYSIAFVVSIISTFGPQYYAIFSTPSTERKRV
jgi:hypothetical protein